MSPDVKKIKTKTEKKAKPQCSGEADFQEPSKVFQLKFGSKVESSVY